MKTSPPDPRRLSGVAPPGQPGGQDQDTKSPLATFPGPDGAGTVRAEGAAFGDYLRQARERTHLTVQQIAAETRISPKFLNALEEGNVKSLPSGMYRRAMLRAYAESVGLDRDAALEQFERTFEPGAGPGAGAAAAETGTPRLHAEAPGPQKAELAAFPARRTRERRRRDTLILLAIVVLAATAVVGLVTGDANQGSAAFAPLPDEPAPVRANAESVSPQPAAAAQPDPIPLARAVAGAARPAGTAPPRPATERAAEPISRPDLPAGATAATPVLETPVPADTAGPVATPPAPVVARATEGQLDIITEPAGARVTVNGTGWGVTPVTVRHLPFGSKQVRITLGGYASQQRTIVLGPDRPGATLRVTLVAGD